MGEVMKIEEISVEEYKVGVINSIQRRYGYLRQQSKMPTFCPDVHGHLEDIGSERRIQ
jgi:hypothetical protein